MSDKTDVHDALITFTDFIYAVVFAIIVQQSFDEIINQNEFPSVEAVLRLLLLVAIFYFFAWDWVLGRLLTLRNPYRSYTCFFCEILIAVFAYGTASAIIKGQIIFLAHFAFFLLFGGLWARRMAPHADERDSQEICMIQILQFNGFWIAGLLFLWWKFGVRCKIALPSVTVVFVGLYFFILAYEMMVPRPSSVIAGPGVPFLARSDLRRIRRFLLKYLP